MGVVVFDSDAVIGYLSASDAHHVAAVEWMRFAVAHSERRLLCAVNLSEVMIGPVRRGSDDVVDAMLASLSIETVVVDSPLAGLAASVRARTGVGLPDAYALATAIQAEARGSKDVRLATFDKAVLRAHAELRSS